MTKYYINDVEVTEKEFEDQLEEAITIDVETYFDDMLDDCCPDYQLGNLIFSASQILYRCDPISYDISKREQIDSDIQDANWELNRENSIEYNNKVFKKVNEE